MLRLVMYSILLSVLIAVALPVLLLLAGLQKEPLVPVGRELTAGDVARAKALIERYDPRGQTPGEVRSLELPERDLSLLLGYGVGRLSPAAAEVDLRPGAASLSVTARMPDNPLGRYLNLRLDLAQVPGGIEVEGLEVGRLRIPGFVVRPLQGLVRDALAGDETLAAVLGSVNGLRVTEDRLTLVYQWRPDLVDQVRARGGSALIDEADRERVLAYSAVIASATREGLFGGKMSLSDLLAPVFAAARERTAGGANAAAENRAAIIALMLYIQGVDVPRLLGEPADGRYDSEARTVTLQGRKDFAQHFLISAGVAAAGGSRLADAVGLFKEIDDSRGGSGFSFTDLAADRAGVRFAETATGAGAARVQGLVADGADEAAYMPEVGDLPEFMPADELARRFGGVGEPAFRRMADAIERRIAALEIHR
jgi:hypothetical protein